MDDFSDDGFDDLNITVLQELETKALQSLEPQRHFERPPNPQGLQNKHDHTGISRNASKVADDVDQADAAVLRQLARVPAQHAVTGRLAAAAAPPPLALPAYSQRSYVDVPLPAASSSNKNGAYYPRASQHRVIPVVSAGGGVSAARPSSISRDPLAGAANKGAAPAGMPGNLAGASGVDNSIIAALQARVRTLETDLYTARGKASMMQDKYEASQRKHEAEVLRIRKQKEEELANQLGRTEAAVAAHQSAAAELEFARHELQEEVEKSRKGRRTDRTEGPTTPRKGAAGRSNWNVADGFDDVELLPSPSKAFGRRLKESGIGAASFPIERTPTKGKRRRPVTDSPTKPLETLAVEDAEMLDQSPATSGGVASAAPAASKQPDEAPFLFIQEILGHRTCPTEPTTLELFSRYSFPSNRKQSLAFIMVQRIPTLDGAQGSTQLIVDFCQLILGIWSQCLREQYLAPVRALVALLSHILQRDPAGIVPHVLESLAPIIHETIYLVAAPAFHSPSGSLSNHPDYNVRQMASDIDTGATMSLLRLVAFGCLSQTQAHGATQTQGQPSQASYFGTSTASQTWFWSLMQFEFVLLMLSSKQAPDAFLGMLALLRTSALPESIGPITNDPDKDAGVVASLIVDRVSHHIVEPPKWATCSKYAEWDVRLVALSVLDCFAQSPFGRLSLAAGDMTLPRLVDALFAAYGELRDRDLLQEPLHPPDALVTLSESEARAYGIGGFDLAQTLCSEPAMAGKIASIEAGSMVRDGREATGVDTHSAHSAQSPQHSGSKGRSHIPLVLLYVSLAVFLLHSIITDPFTGSVANIPAKLADMRGSTREFYLLTMARLGFHVDPALAVGLGEETHRLAMELFKLAATPSEHEEYSKWATWQGRGQGRSSGGRPGTAAKDPFSDNEIGALGTATAVIKIEDA